MKNATTSKPTSAVTETTTTAETAAAPADGGGKAKCTEARKEVDPLDRCVGEVVLAYRLKRKLTLEACAQLAGVARQTVRFIECATYAVKLRTLHRVCRALRVSVLWVLQQALARLGGAGC